MTLFKEANFMYQKNDILFFKKMLCIAFLLWTAPCALDLTLTLIFYTAGNYRE